MIDSELRQLKNRLLEKWISPDSVNPDFLTVIGFLSGISAMGFLCTEEPLWATFFFLMNRIFDVLDGFFAQSRKNNDLGAFSDLVADYVVYLGIPIVLARVNPELQFQLLVLVSLFTFNLLLWTYPQVIKSVPQEGVQRYPRSIVEGVETAIFYVVMFWQPEIVCLFNVLMVLTVVHRLVQGYIHLKEV